MRARTYLTAGALALTAGLGTCAASCYDKPPVFQEVSKAYSDASAARDSLAKLVGRVNELSGRVTSDEVLSGMRTASDVRKTVTSAADSLDEVLAVLPEQSAKYDSLGNRANETVNKPAYKPAFDQYYSRRMKSVFGGLGGFVAGSFLMLYGALKKKDEEQ